MIFDIRFPLCLSYRRTHYLTNEEKILVALQDEFMALPVAERRSPFAEALERSDLARALKKVFDDMCSSGKYVLDRWINWY